MEIRSALLKVFPTQERLGNLHCHIESFLSVQSPSAREWLILLGHMSKRQMQGLKLRLSGSLGCCVSGGSLVVVVKSRSAGGTVIAIGFPRCIPVLERLNPSLGGIGSSSLSEWSVDPTAAFPSHQPFWSPVPTSRPLPLHRVFSRKGCGSVLRQRHGSGVPGQGKQDSFKGSECRGSVRAPVGG